jgi:uncharacterized protein
MTLRPPLPPFTRESAIEKIRLAEDGWNSRDAARVALAYTPDTQWRNRVEFVSNRAEAQAFLERKWRKELDYRLIKELWAFEGHRIAVRYAYEWHDDAGTWFRSYGNENWEFSEDGLMQRRFASINDMPIPPSERKFHWPLGRRPDDHPGLSANPSTAGGGTRPGVRRRSSSIPPSSTMALKSARPSSPASSIASRRSRASPCRTGACWPRSPATIRRASAASPRSPWRSSRP